MHSSVIIMKNIKFDFNIGNIIMVKFDKYLKLKVLLF